MKEQPNPVSGLWIPEGAANPFSLQPRAGKQEMNKKKNRTVKKWKMVWRRRKTLGYFQMRRCWIPSLVFWLNKSIWVSERRPAPRRHLHWIEQEPKLRSSIRVGRCPVQNNNPPILRLGSELRPTSDHSSPFREKDWVSPAPLNAAFQGGRQMRSSRWSSRWSSDTGCCCWLAGSESDDDAAATAAAASAVKFMLIESEAAAASASFLPAQLFLRFFLRSSQTTPPHPLK